jgi:hypothetical protein
VRDLSISPFQYDATTDISSFQVLTIQKCVASRLPFETDPRYSKL